jgi:flagellar hook-associated protein 1
MTGLLSNAISGLQASQNALRTAGHNISNANTEGYSRQKVNFATRPEQNIGAAGFIGAGVNTVSIERIVNEFVTTQLRLDTSAYNQLSKFNANISKVDKLVADVGTGLTSSLQTFFAAMQNGADDPASTSSRQLIIKETQSLTTRFNDLYSRMREVEKGVNDELKVIASQMEAVAKTIAELNQSIAISRASGNGDQPNDLLDKRDNAIKKLAEFSSIQINTEVDGDINVFIGNGQPLVISTQVSAFNVTNDGKLQLKTNAALIDITEQLSGGQIGGLYNFRDNVLHKSMNSLGRIAIAMADEYNQQQAKGIDLDGDYGLNLFSDINDPSVAQSRVIQEKITPPYDRILSLTIDDTSLLTTSDYRFEILPSSQTYQITRLSDNNILDRGVLSGAYPQAISFEGLSLNLTSGSFQGGDSFLIKPTETGARDIATLIEKPNDLAFASPIRTKTSSSNSGTGTISAGEVLSVVDENGNTLPAFSQAGKLSPPIIIRFTSSTTYDVLDNSDPGNPKELVPAMRNQQFIPGVSNSIFTADKGETRIIGNGSVVGLPLGSLSQTQTTPPDLPGPMVSTSLAQSNGYLAEQLRFSILNPDTGQITTKAMTTVPGASAAQTAAQISNIPGVSANAFTTATLTNINFFAGTFLPPLQLSVNGQSLLQYDVAGTAFTADVPDPNVSEADFNDYLAARINNNTALKAQGITALSGNNPTTGAPELRLLATSGVDLDIRLSASNAAVNSIDVNDGTNPSVSLVGQDDPLTLGVVEQAAITVGGKIDITLASGISLQTVPGSSGLFGDSSAANFSQSVYKGYQVAIGGQPKTGDVFTLDFNTNGKNDNRNALAMIALETEKTLEAGAFSFGGGYEKLVIDVGTQSSSAQVNMEASKSLLAQTESLRSEVSGVNLDEEAGDLIKFQQLYQANARVITVARELFDSLLNAF